MADEEGVELRYQERMVHFALDSWSTRTWTVALALLFVLGSVSVLSLARIALRRRPQDPVIYDAVRERRNATAIERDPFVVANHHISLRAAVSVHRTKGRGGARVSLKDPAGKVILVVRERDGDVHRSELVATLGTWHVIYDMDGFTGWFEVRVTAREAAVRPAAQPRASIRR